MERPICIPDESATARAALPEYLRAAVRQCRDSALSALRQTPAFVSAAKKLTATGRYRVLVSKGHAHLLREGADGITKTALRNAKGQFTENVDLVRIPTDIAGALAVVAMQAALIEMSVRLNVVIRCVGNIDELIRTANVGALQGAIDAMDNARCLRSDNERRTSMLAVCSQLTVEMGKVAGQLKAHVARMPLPETGFWTGWNGDGLEKTEAAWNAVQQDFAVLCEGLRRLMNAYFYLDEFEAASGSFSRICTGSFLADLRVAIDRARLLPYPEVGPGPEHALEVFLSGIPIVEQRLKLLAGGEVPDLELDFETEGVLQ